MNKVLVLSIMAVLMLSGVSYGASLTGLAAFSPAVNSQTPALAIGVGHIQSAAAGLSFSPKFTKD